MTKKIKWDLLWTVIPAVLTALLVLRVISILAFAILMGGYAIALVIAFMRIERKFRQRSR